MADKDRKYYQKLYEILQKQYSKEELAEAFVFPPDVSESEKAKIDQEFWELRKRRLINRSTHEKMLAGLLRFKYELEDYVLNSNYDPDKGVPYFLSDYLNITNKQQGELAEDIAIHKTRMSRIMNGKERLSLPITYRLERHSGDTIPAILWWKLVQKEVEQEIKENIEERQKEKNKVKAVAYQKL